MNKEIQEQVDHLKNHLTNKGASEETIKEHIFNLLKNISHQQTLDKEEQNQSSTNS